MITNRQVICDALMARAKDDRDVVVLCSDSRGSAAMTPFFQAFPEQSVEVGIAEQNLVSVAAGLAACGKKPFVFSPASFLSTRSYEQAKIDVAYSGMNVKLIGISGGISYGALGMTHHACQDIAAFSALTGMRVYLPSDRFQTRRLMDAIVGDSFPAYIRVSRGASPDLYDENMGFALDRANILREGGEVLLVACGEMVSQALVASEILARNNICCGVVDMYCLKPFDADTLVRLAEKAHLVVTVEEHVLYGGLAALTAQTLGAHCPRLMLQLALADEHLISGDSREVFAYYGLNGEGIARSVLEEYGRIR